MIPKELRERWDRECDRREIIFLADSGGGWPDVLAAPGLTPEGRLDILRGLGFRIMDRFEMQGYGDDWDKMWPWVRLTNDVAVCLQDGFVNRSREWKPPWKRKPPRKKGGAAGGPDHGKDGSRSQVRG